MDAMKPKDNKLTSSQVYQILATLGYEWSNEAQCYYSTDFKLAPITGRQGYELAKRLLKILCN